MTKVYYDRSVEKDATKVKIAIIGYGSQGHACSKP